MKVMIALAAGLVLGLGPVQAAAPAAAKPDAPQLDAYVRTGLTRSCLVASRIRSARILNDHQILFEMQGGSDYLNEPAPCAGLRKNRAISYRLTDSSLCSNTIFQVLEPSSAQPVLGACGLKRFQELKDKEAAAD